MVVLAFVWDRFLGPGGGQQPEQASVTGLGRGRKTDIPAGR